MAIKIKTSSSNRAVDIEEYICGETYYEGGKLEEIERTAQGVASTLARLLEVMAIKILSRAELEEVLGLLNHHYNKLIITTDEEDK